MILKSGKSSYNKDEIKRAEEIEREIKKVSHEFDFFDIEEKINFVFERQNRLFRVVTSISIEAGIVLRELKRVIKTDDEMNSLKEYLKEREENEIKRET